MLVKVSEKKKKKSDNTRDSFINEIVNRVLIKIDAGMRINFVAIWINSNGIGTISGFARRGWRKSVQMFLVKFNFSDPHICTVGQILFNTADTFCWIIFSYSQFVVLELCALTTSWRLALQGKSLLFTKKLLQHITPRKITFLGTFPTSQFVELFL